MRAAAQDGRLQVTAAVGLLESSRLLQWNPNVLSFQPVERDVFERTWRSDVHPVFGRFICWIVFAVGAESLAKGVCLLNGVEIRRQQKVPAYPTGDMAKWATAVWAKPEAAGTMTSTHYGTIGKLTRDYGTTSAALKRLCSAVKATSQQREIVVASYQLLGRTIRNRDAHAYVPNVRDSHYELVPQLFSSCFNVLTRWLPGGPPTLKGMSH